MFALKRSNLPAPLQAQRIRDFTGKAFASGMKNAQEKMVGRAAHARHSMPGTEKRPSPAPQWQARRPSQCQKFPGRLNSPSIDTT
jgi:hypothetical protein